MWYICLSCQMSWREETEVYICHEQWPNPSSRRFFTMVSLTLQFIIPCCIISFCYWRVSSTLRMRASLRIRSASSNNNNASRRDHTKIKRKRKTTRMLIAMVAIFVCCWLPLNIIHIILEFYDDLSSSQYFLLIFFVGHVVAMSSAVYNPFIYAWMNENFNKAFHNVLPSCYVSRGCRSMLVKFNVLLHSRSASSAGNTQSSSAIVISSHESHMAARPEVVPEIVMNSCLQVDDKLTSQESHMAARLEVVPEIVVNSCLQNDTSTPHEQSSTALCAKSSHADKLM